MRTICWPPSRLARAVVTACAAAAATGVSLASPGPFDDAPMAGLEAPFRRLAPPRALMAGRAVLHDEADDADLRSALSAELQRLASDLYGRDGWRAPFDEKAPLRIHVARRPVEAMQQTASQWLSGGRMIGPAVLVDGRGRNTPQIVREVARQILRATLSAYGAPEDSFLAPAVIEALAGESADDGEAWNLAAAPMLDFRGSPSILGRLFIDEIIRERGDTSLLRLAWERAAASGERPLTLMFRMLDEASGPAGDALLARCAARLYVTLETEASPSRLKLFDLETGALDAAAPAALSVRHRAFLPEESEQELQVSWPADGGFGAAVVRYQDAALPADVAFFGPGDVRRIPLSGVARVDWVIAGSQGGGLGIQAPVSIETTEANVFTGLQARATGGPEPPRLTWRTASHDGIWGWAVFREELRPDGRVARAGPEIVPSSERSEDSFGYVFVDSGATAGTFYRYTVWAVTDEGLLARAFAVTMQAGD